MGLSQAGIQQMEPDGLAELAGAWSAETHYHWCCNTERTDAELTLHAGWSLWFRTSGPKLLASSFIFKIPRLCWELLHLCNNACDAVNLQHLLAGDAWCHTCYKPWSLMRIRRQGSQSCLAGQHRTALRRTCVTLTVSSGSGRAAESWEAVGRGPG